MAKHTLKTWPVPFAALWDGAKTFEVRENDRGFEAGDTLYLKEWLPGFKEYTGRVLAFTVGYIARGPDWGLPANMVVMSLLSPERDA